MATLFDCTKMVAHHLKRSRSERRCVVVVAGVKPFRPCGEKQGLASHKNQVQKVAEHWLVSGETQQQYFHTDFGDFFSHFQLLLTSCYFLSCLVLLTTLSASLEWTGPSRV